MDVTGLSVSIEVDMSGFMDAMEKLAALIMTITDELKDLQGGFNDTAKGIQQLNDNAADATDTVGDLIDVAIDLVEIFMGDEEAAIPFFLHLARLAVDAKKAIDDLNKSREQMKAPTVAKQPEQIKPDTTTNRSSLDPALKGTMQDPTVAKVYDPETNSYITVPKTGTSSPSSGQDSTMQSGGGQNNMLANMAAAGADTNYNKLPVIAQDDTKVATNAPPPLSSVADTGKQIDESQKKLEDFKKNLEQVQQMMGKIDPVLKITVDATSVSDGMTEVINQQNIYTQAINNTNVALGKEKTAQDGVTHSADQQKDILKALSSLSTQAVEGLAEAVGQMAAGKKVNIGAAMAQMLGDAVESYGKHLIEISGIMALGVDAMSVPKLAEGTALVALGAGIKASAKMAAGGIVSGSSFVNVGEYAGASHNPEVIAPLDKLKGYMGGQHQTHSFEIQGDKLVSILSRVDSNSSFALGGNQ